jgi:ribosomal protein L37E
MKEQMIMCPRCGGNACHEASNEKLTVWSCFGCGFTSNSTIVEGNLQEVESVVPQLYLDLKFKDANGYYWYPNTVILEDKSMVFADGKTTEDWKWAGVQSKDGNADMTTIKHFEEKDFMEALDYIGFFEKQK